MNEVLQLAFFFLYVGEGGLGTSFRDEPELPFAVIPWNISLQFPFTQVVKEFLIPKSYKCNSSFPGIEVANQIENGQGMTNPFLILGHR